MPAFEPSTWAEVEEATATDKVTPEDPFVTQVRHFTDAPERFSTVRSLGELGESSANADTETIFPFASQRNARPKRAEGQFDDLLGFGRVDLETETFVRKHVHPITSIAFPVESSSVINPSSQNFDPAKYLSKVHKDSTEDQLKQGRKVLADLRTRLDEQAEKLRSEKYVSATLVEAAFESTKQSLLPLSPYDQDGSDRETERVFRQAEATLKERYEDVMRRETKLARLQRALDVYKRYEWVFQLGERLRTAAGEDVTAIEEAMREYSRGVTWVEAQDVVKMRIIQNDMEAGFNVLIEAIIGRLSTAHLTRNVTSRLVAVLTSVKKDDLLAHALNKRIAFAKEGLKKAGQSSDSKTLLHIGDVRTTEHDVCDHVSRASNSFYNGVSHVWRLGRVLMHQDRWLRVVDEHLKSLCEAYAAILRERLLKDPSLISRNCCKEIATVQTKVSSELQIPEACLSSLEIVISDITEAFVKSISGAVLKGANHIAEQAVRNDTVATQASKIVQALALEALSQVSTALFKKQDVGEEPKSTIVNSELDEPISISPDRRPTTVDLLGKACIEAPSLLAKEVYGRMQDSSLDQEVCSLKVAVCCSELVTGALVAVRKQMQQESPFDVRTMQRQLRISSELIEGIQKKSLSTHGDLVSKPLKTLAASLVLFPKDELEDAVSRTVPIKIEGVSKGANELVLQLALVMITTRKRSSNIRLIRHILLHLISEIGRTLVDVLSTDKLAYHRGAQLWVDVTYMQEMVTKGAHSEGNGVQEALDGFSRVKERAVQAVLADGYSFSLADMQALKKDVVVKGMDEAAMVCQCLAETWRLLKDDGSQEG